jgi:hypothetical protein
MEYGLNPPQLPLFTATLLSHSLRWEHIRLVIPFHDLRWIDGPFPLLRDLTFKASDYSMTGLGGETATAHFRDAHQLKSVVLGLVYNPSPLVLPWSQLTCITAEAVCLVYAADILRQATALVDLTCTLYDDDVVPGTVPPLVHLQSLILHDDEIDPGPQQLLLDVLTTPALRHLTVSERELGDEPISTIATFLSRSHCSLQSLHVNKAHLPKTTYCAAFPSIPIIHLNIDVQPD